MTRQCRSCELFLPENCFWRQASRRDGLQSECKSCMKIRTTAYHRQHRERIRPKNNLATAKKRRSDPIKNILAQAKSRAKANGHDFSITADDLVFPELCPVFGRPLSFGLGHGLGMKLAERDWRYSLDRIDNARGYVPGNVIVVSYRANRIKSDASAEELIKVARFYERLEAEKSGQADMPAMQPREEEEDRTVSVGNCD